MNNTIQYKGYVGSVEFSEEDGIFILTFSVTIQGGAI